jgi:hypothetical protein
MPKKTSSHVAIVVDAVDHKIFFLTGSISTFYEDCQLGIPLRDHPLIRRVITEVYGPAEAIKAAQVRVYAVECSPKVERGT